MTTGNAISIRGLVKEYRRKKQVTRAVDGLDLEVHRGEVFGLLGPNGAGKTTTVEVCEGLLAPDGGEVRVLGRTWADAGDELRQRIGVSLQETRFHEKQTVREILTLFRCFYAAGRPVEEVLDLVQLREKADTFSLHLSGGQHQRLAVACALVGAPELLFLDEPTTGLDPQSRRQLWEVVREFRARGGTVLLTTHYMDEAEQLCDRIAIVDHGKRIALGSSQELVASIGGDHVVEVTAKGLSARVTEPELAGLASVRRCKISTDSVLLTVQAPHLVVPALLQLLAARGLQLDGLATRHTSLEDVFVHLTGRHLRDEAA